MSATFTSAVYPSPAVRPSTAGGFMNLAIPVLVIWAAIVASVLINPSISSGAEDTAVQSSPSGTP